MQAISKDAMLIAAKSMSQKELQINTYKWAEQIGKVHYWTALKNVALKENMDFLKKLSAYDHLHCILAVLPDHQDDESIRTLANRFYNEC